MHLLPGNIRYERKFLPEALGLAKVLAVVRQHPCAFREVYPPRFVNNIYLDSPGRSDYHDHVAGVPNRSKTRIRWYGAPAGAIARPVLEHKLKRGAVSGKLSYGLPSFSLRGDDLCRSVELSLQAAAIPEQVRWRIRHLEPVLVNRYHRWYFLSGDATFRLTVDAGLEFGSPSGWGGSGLITPEPSLVIVELKFAPRDAADADRVTNGLPFRLARCSKYVLGIERLAQAAAWRWAELETFAGAPGHHQGDGN